MHEHQQPGLLPRCGLCGALQRQQRQVDHHGLLGFLAISRTGVVPGNAPLWRLAKSAAAGGYAACASSKAIASMARMEYMTSRLRYRGREVMYSILAMDAMAYEDAQAA